MKFSELVRVLEREGFKLVKEQGLNPLLYKAWRAPLDSD